jgi:hypothetical protein
MKFTITDVRLLRRLADLLNRLDPVPAEVIAEAQAAVLHVSRREPRLASRALDLNWLLPSPPAWNDCPD